MKKISLWSLLPLFYSVLVLTPTVEAGCGTTAGYAGNVWNDFGWDTFEDPEVPGHILSQCSNNGQNCNWSGIAGDCGEGCQHYPGGGQAVTVNGECPCINIGTFSCTAVGVWLPCHSCTTNAECTNGALPASAGAACVNNICVVGNFGQACTTGTGAAGTRNCSGTCVATPCTPSCACAANTCTGQTCANGCSGTCAGTRDCSTPPPPVNINPQAIGDPLTGAYAYPSPYKPSVHGNGITFNNLNSDPTVHIKIFTVKGELVQELHNTGGSAALNWNVTNKDGQAVASGVYIYRMTNSAGKEKAGKLLIAR